MINRQHVLILSLFLVGMLLQGCEEQETPSVPISYEFLPENMVAFNSDNTVSARYVDPVTRYAHGALGDKVEAGGLLVTRNNKQYYYSLGEDYVFEDLQPRIIDVDKDGQEEFITIQTRLMSGAGISIYKIINERLVLYAQSRFIGTPYRWLNIAAINDLDGDGAIEIAWIETPHIGGVLKIGRISGDSLLVIDEKDGLSNHQYGLRNLCLSVVTVSGNVKTLYVPNNPHTAIIGFTFHNDQISAKDTITLNVDPEVPLFMQYNFQNLPEDRNCIYFRGPD